MTKGFTDPLTETDVEKTAWPDKSVNSDQLPRGKKKFNRRIYQNVGARKNGA